MQKVIGLIEKLRAAGIEVPQYPVLDAPFSSPYPPHDPDGALLQARVDAFEAKVVAWRAEVVATYAKHFPQQV
ncbi:hypothetical protein VLK31_34560 [Variovorax sp. H27-G14]|uniref:hypothetical protein n=1 Tax=Variovorax sp. H27-G14 TaxID=3111914 RepID=UPI0038FBF73B